MALVPKFVTVRGGKMLHLVVPSTPTSRRYLVSMRTSDLAEARRKVTDTKVLELVEAGRTEALTKQFYTRLIVGRDVTIEQARDQFLASCSLRGMAPTTLRNYEWVLDRLFRIVGGTKAGIGTIKPAQLAGFVNGSGKAGYATRVFWLRRLRGFFDFCCSNNWMPVNPCLNLAVRTQGLSHDQLVSKKKQPFTQEQIDVLLAHVEVDDFWYAAILIGRYFALRISTVAILEWASLPDLKRITVFTHKGRAIVDEPLPPVLAEWFRNLPRGESIYCFPAQAALVDSLASKQLSEQFSRICVKAGIKDRTYHCFRVTAANAQLDRALASLGGAERAAIITLIAERGMAGVQKLLGHVAGSTVTSDHYLTAPAPSGTPPQ